MGTEAERQDTRKAVILDLLQILKKDPDKKYSVDELEKLMYAFIVGTDSK